MQKTMEEIVVFLSHSHQQSARILEAKRQVAVRMADLIHGLPDVNPQLAGSVGLVENCTQVTGSVIAYLNSLAELANAMADSLEIVVRAAIEENDAE